MKGSEDGQPGEVIDEMTFNNNPPPKKKSALKRSQQKQPDKRVSI